MKKKMLYKVTKRLWAGLLTMVLLFSTVLTEEAVFADEYSLSSGLPAISGQVMLDTDPEGGYQGDYVLIYNNSLNPSNVQSTGIISNIDTARARAARSVDEMDDGLLDYHPEPMMLSENFDFSQLETMRADYQVGDTRSFKVEQPFSGITKNMEFSVVYSGNKCYIWAPAPVTYRTNIRMWQDEATEDDINSDGEFLLEEDEALSEGADEFHYLEDDAVEDGYENESEHEEGRTDYSIQDRALNTYKDERDYRITDQMAEEAGQAFDDFYDTMNDNFGTPVDADSTGKVSLLMYDIQDGNDPRAYIGGFFDSRDLNNSNGTAMLHIDTYPSIFSAGATEGKVSKAFSTMVHEFQHLLNYSKYFQNREDGMPEAVPMDTWLNEAMSMAAEEMIFPESAIPMRKNYYNNDNHNVIRNGKSLLDFDNSLESYSMSSLFSAYLERQTGSYEVFSRILANYTNSEKTAIEEAVLGTSLDEMTFEDIIAAYRTALVLQDDKGLYGFKGQPLLSDIKVLNYNQEGQSVSLQGGSAIVVKTKDGVFTPGSGSGGDVRFVGMRLAEDGVTVTKKPDKLSMIMGESFEVQGIATISGVVRPDIQWSSSDPQIAAVSGIGENCTITAQQEGTVEIVASCDGFQDSFWLDVYKSPELSDFGGLTIQGKEIFITSNEGMYSFEKMVNGVTPVGMTDGLEGYDIYLMTSVDVENWTPIGSELKTFKGKFHGNNFKIVLRGLANDNFADAGVFGVNEGEIWSIGVDLRGSITGKDVGALVGENKGNIIRPVINIDRGVTIKGKTPDSVNERISAGGVAGSNRNKITNSQVTNYGTIGSQECHRTGGVTGYNEGTATTHEARISGAEVYNHGIIISSDDTGGVVGLMHGNTSGSFMDGKIHLTVSDGGKVTSTDSRTASVGGVVGFLAYSYSMIENAEITVRMDGQVLSEQGNGCSGGVIGQCSDSQRISSDTAITLTLGPEATVSTTIGGDFGLISGYDYNINRNMDKWIYAVPYDTVATPFPAGSTNNNTVKRVEYPKAGNPNPTITVSAIQDTNISTTSNVPGGGIFIPKIGITHLNVLSAEDDNLFAVDDVKQVVRSKAKTAPNYFDFNLVAEGMPITVPAYLELDHTDTLLMNLEIQGDHVEDAEEAAKANRATNPEKITVLCENGRISDGDWTLKQWQAGAFKDYKPNQYISTNSPNKKEFTLNEEGLYEISATGTAIFDNSKEARTKYVMLGGLPPSIIIIGEHLTEAPTEKWTNLLKSEQSAVNPSEQSALTETTREELITVKAINTSIDKNDFKKEAVPYSADLKAEIENSSSLPVERAFVLYETGRYKIIGRGRNVSEDVVRYVNIDVDNPMSTVLKDVQGTVISPDADYAVILPTENHIQSPIHAEYSIDGGAFVPLTETTIRLNSGNRSLSLKTLDAATNESDIVTYTLETSSSSSSRKSRGTRTKQDGLPYYYKNNDSQNSSGPKIFIGITDKLDGETAYIAPPGKNIYFIDNPKDFRDIQGHWAKGEIDFVTEREIFVGTNPQIFSPDEDMTRGMFAAVIGRMYERSYQTVVKGMDCPFTDVEKEYYYTDYINWAAENKIILGVGEGKFEPERSITREEMGAIMYRFAKFLNLSKDISNVELTFADTDMVSDWAVESTKYCQATGLVVGRGLNHFEPEETAHRAEVSTVIHRFVDELLTN